MPSTVARVASGLPLFFFGAFGTLSFFSQRGIHNACKLVTFPQTLNPDLGPALTEAECGAVFLSAVRSAPRGKADATAALVYFMVSTIIRIEGICFAMIGVMGWYTLLCVKFEQRHPIHLALAAFCVCAILVDGNIFGLVPFGHDDGLMPTGALGQKIQDAILPLLCVWCVMLPCNLFAFFASKGGDAKSKAA